jgi:2-keto-4-pentenoate hydratase/2-oxohepta-3-ene-1,7-dioic acid hydratase in catechol pathway
LAAIVGRRCSRVDASDALDYVAGYTVLNDVSARDLQLAVSQWTAGKAIDTFAPMGPGLVLADDVGDPQDLELTTRVNGDVVQHGSTSMMIFDVATLISYISNLITLEPGDIIGTGTPSGVGWARSPQLFLKHGDVVEVEVERVGTITNPVTA